MKKIIFFVLLIMLTFSCRTSRSVIDTTKKINSTSVNDINVKAESSGMTDKTMTLLDKSITIGNFSETVTELTYAPPDSTGTQHITKKTVSIRKSNTKKAADIVNSEKVNNKSETKKNIFDKTKQSSSSQVTTVEKKTEKTKTPGVVNWAIILPVVVLLIFIYLFLKKKKII